MQQEMTVLFSDIRDFTTISETMTPQDNFDFLNEYLGRVGPVIRENGGFIDKYIGDAVMAIFPEAEGAVRGAVAMARAASELRRELESEGRPGVEIGIALSAVALGAVVLREVKPALPVAAGLVGFFAIFHGHAHGTELPDGASGLYYSIGFVMATGLLHAAGIGFGMIHSRPHGPAILRAAGGLVMVAGFYFLWQALA